ncbi:LysR family transcriptional regulator [Pseudoxanthomonas kalamensis DSM 18571]|uniref:LysR family transcriptional regulator n=1 Tax=Pseudoxanthomonas kalamensis TaxID=289483 RepID=UPI001391B58A|nr:LysR family transcriptional regulator [Pseudoxanthomonas kalamensis]KAF1709781.1 LysR family transcriptional regulator [Pseudoxanthomonas kalamensis DSM 18571]
MDLLQSLGIFSRVAEAGSFSRAADALGMATSSVSAAVQRLEQHLGVPLFQRTTRKVRLSSEGEVLYERAAQLLGDAEDVRGLFRRDRLPSGQLRVEVPARIARTLIAPALPGFLARYPDISLELGSTDRLSNLVEEGIDCVLRVGELNVSGLVARPLGRFAVGTFASPALIERHGMPTDPPTLARLPVVHFGRIAAGKHENWEYQDDSGQLLSLDLRGSVSVGNAEAYIACCEAGLGMIQVPRYDVAELLALGRLVEIVLPGLHAPSLPVSVLYPPSRRLSRALQAFVEWLDDLLAPHLE